MISPKVSIKKSPGFTFAVAKIRFWESKLLTTSIFYQLADSKDLPQLQSILNPTAYASKIALPDFDDSMDSEEFATLKELKSFLKDYKFIMPFFYKRDFHNLKLIAKSKYTNVEADWLKEGFISKEIAIKVIAEQDLTSLPKIYRGFINQIWNMYEKTDHWQIFDTFLDKKLYEQILNVTKEVSFANGFFKTEIDLINIKTLVRRRNNPARQDLADENTQADLFSQLFIDGGFMDKTFFVETYKEQIDKLSQRLKFTPYDILAGIGTEDSKSFDYEIEKRCCLVLLKYLSCAKYTAFGYEPILRYVFSKNNEIRNLRTIFVGKLHNLSSEEIKARIGPFDA
ncbi:V-type ATPase subunit [bacterium]|nr:V-type ATPase subunit [bacterium]